MENAKTNIEKRQGILALIDIVNYTGQAVRAGDVYTPKFTEYFKTNVKRISLKHSFQVVKYIGDAALIFGTEPAGVSRPWSCHG